MKVVRYYTTKTMTGYINFKCVFCSHFVTTQDFDIRKGNRRTQAARVMNQHAKDLHSTHNLTPSGTLGSRGVL